MNDTTPEIERLLRARYAEMSGSERALMALQMFETAQRIVLSSLDAGLSADQRRRELCRRFYGDEMALAAYPQAGSSPASVPAIAAASA
jgi:hypothetical protein